MTGSDDTSDIELGNDPTFQVTLDRACKSAFKRYSRPPYDSWQELRNEVFIRVCKYLSRAEYRHLTHAERYLYRIAVNDLISKRRNPKTPRRENFIDLDEVNLAHWTEKQLRDEILTDELLALLNKDEQFIIVSWMDDDKTLTEIADDLGISKTTMSKRFVKIIQKLQRRLNVTRQ
jgi:RNA polymerase sigma factor (sigma-70 family)